MIGKYKYIVHMVMSIFVSHSVYASAGANVAIPLEESLDHVAAAIQEAGSTGQSVHLVFGASPSESHMSAVASDDTKRIFWNQYNFDASTDTAPIITGDFNATYGEEWSSLYPAHKGKFDAIYFDWSTLKFADFSYFLMVDLFGILKEGGKLYIPDTSLLSDLEFGETAAAALLEKGSDLGKQTGLVTVALQVPGVSDILKHPPYLMQSQPMGLFPHMAMLKGTSITIVGGGSDGKGNAQSYYKGTSALDDRALLRVWPSFEIERHEAGHGEYPIERTDLRDGSAWKPSYITVTKQVG